VNATAATTTPIANAASDRDWQSVQKHAYTPRGGCVIV
jgi:hypothetical protein